MSFLKSSLCYNYSNNPKGKLVILDYIAFWCSLSMKNQPNFCSLREKLHKIAPIKLLCPSSLGKLQLEISDQGLGVVQMPSDHLSTWHL